MVEEVAARIAADERQARDWALVLQAAGVQCRMGAGEPGDSHRGRARRGWDRADAADAAIPHAPSRPKRPGNSRFFDV